MGNPENKPTVKASMVVLIPEREEGQRFEGKDDVNDKPEMMINEGFDIPVGDCQRNNVMPSKEQISEMSEARAKREKLAGKSSRQLGQDR